MKRLLRFFFVSLLFRIFRCFLLGYVLTVFLLLLDVTLFDSILVTFCTVFAAYFILDNIPSSSWLPYFITFLTVLWVVSYGPDDKTAASKLGVMSSDAAALKGVLVLGDRMLVDLAMAYDPALACGAAKSQFKDWLKNANSVNPKDVEVSYEGYSNYSRYHVRCNYEVTIGGEDKRPVWFNLQSWQAPDHAV